MSTISPWPQLVEIATHLHRLYSPGDDSEEWARCDVRMLLEATRRCIEALGATVQPGAEIDHSPEAAQDLRRAITALLQTYYLVLRGLYGDVRNAAHDANELSKQLDGLHGPA